MKSGKKIFLSVILVMVLLSLIYGCRNPLGGKGSVDISITLLMPDYHNRQSSSIRAIQASYIGGLSEAPRVVDPATNTVEVTVSASDMDTITRTFSFAETGSYGSGTGEIVCNITGVPLGSDRQFDVVTKDAGGNTLTTGTAVSDVFMWTGNSIDLTMLPANAEAITPGVAVSGTLEYSRIAFYTVTLENPGDYTVYLISGQDTDLYVYDNEGSIYAGDVWQAGSPTNESAAIVITESASFYFGVFGNTEGVTNEFALVLRPPRRIAFMSYRDGNAEIYVMNTDGSNQTRLTNNAVDDDAYPAW